MVSKFICALMFLVMATVSAYAQTGSAKTQAQLNAEVNTLWPNNSAGLITPFNARQTLLDMIASSSGSGGSGSGSPTLTRTMIASATISPSTLTIISTGYRTANDLGNGCVYSSSGATSNGLGAITTANGVVFNLVFPNGVANIGCFGAYANDGATVIGAGDISANPQWRGTYTAGTPWDQVALQELWYAAFAGTSTPGVINWNTVTGNQTLNKIAYIPTGRYGVTSRTTLNMQGGTVLFGTKNTTTIDWVGPLPVDYAVYCDGCSYSYLQNPGVTYFASQDYNNRHALWAFDWSGNIASIKTQQNTIVNFYCGVETNGRCIDMSPTGSGSQGDTNQFINLFCGGNGSDYCMNINGNNTLNNTVVGGDCQLFFRNCFQVNGGQLSIYNFHDENENLNQSTVAPLMTQFTLYGASFQVNTQVDGSGVSLIDSYRSEAEVLAYAYSHSGTFVGPGTAGINIRSAFAIGNDILTLATSTSYQEGTVVQGGTDGRVFMLADAGGTDWRRITSYVGSVITDSTAAYTTNQWAHYNLLARFGSSGFFQSCDIVSNTATTITLDSGCASASSQAEYQIVGITGTATPSWNSAALGVQAAFTGGGQGFNTTATSTCIFVPSSVGSPSPGDYVAIPNARTVGGVADNNSAFPTVYVGKLVTSGVCGAGGNWTVNRAPNVTVSQAPGYTATPVAETGNSGVGTLDWIDLEWVSAGPANVLQDVTVPGGTIEAGGQFQNVLNTGANTKNDGIDTTFITGVVPVVTPGQYNITINGTTFPFLYSAAVQALPSCSGINVGSSAAVSDATSPITYHSAYASGGTIKSGVFCPGSSWIND